MSIRTYKRDVIIASILAGATLGAACRAFWIGEPLLAVACWLILYLHMEIHTILFSIERCRLLVEAAKKGEAIE